MSIPLYVPATLNDGPNSGPIMIPFVDALPLNPTSSRVLILDAATGAFDPGMYVYDDQTQVWKFAMPIEVISTIIVDGDTVGIYVHVIPPVTLASTAVVYRNGALQVGTVLDSATVTYAVRFPKQGTGSGDVNSVNGVTPDVAGNVAITASDIPGLAAVATSGQYSDLIGAPGPYTLPVATDTILGGVLVPGASNISIDAQGNIDIKAAIINQINSKLNDVVSGGTGVTLISGKAAGIVTLNSLVAGTNITLTPDGQGNILVASTGGGGALTLSGDVTGTGTGTVVTTLANSGVVAGTYKSVTVDLKGRVTAGTNPTTLAEFGITDALPLAGGSMTGSITMTSGSTVKGVPDPLLDDDVANKAYVDAAQAAAANGVSWRAAVDAATTANIALTGLQTIDGYAVLAGNRVLVKNQTVSSQNGIYVAAAGAWTRATDSDTDAEVFRAAVLISNGTTLALTQWANTNSSAPVVGTDPITYGQLKGAANVYVAGAGLALAGLTFSIAATGVTPGTYTKVTVNAQGQVTTGANLTNADVVASLGFTPYNGTTNPNGYISGAQTVTLAGGDVTGTGPLSGSINAVLTNSGVTPGTYTKVTVDAKGRVTLGANLTNAEIVAAIGYTPVNRAGDTMTGALNNAAIVTVASAATTAIGAAASNNVNVSGTVTITAFDAISAGSVRNVKFTGILTLTHNVTTLQLPGAANIVTAVGDYAQFTSLGGGSWRCDIYYRADGTALVATGGSGSPFSTTQVFNGSATQLAAKVNNIAEVVKIIAAVPAGTAINIAEGSVQYFTTAATANWVSNIRLSATTALNTALAIGESVTATLLTTQGATPFMLTGVQVDGVAATLRWQGGTAPTGGNASGIDAYSIVIIKTGNAAFTVLASQTQFK